MVDNIRRDAAGGLTVTYPTTAKPGDPVVLGTEGLEVKSQRSNVTLELIGTTITAGTDKVLNHVYSTSNITGKILPRDAVLVGISVALQAALSAGSATVQVQRAGADVAGATLAVASGDQRKTTWFGNTGPSYTAGQSIGAVLKPDASFAPTSGQIANVTLYFAMP